MTDLGTAHDLLEAIRLAEGAIAARDADPQAYSLVRAERLLAGGPRCSGVHCWRLTFKLKQLIPDEQDERVGKGGELFFSVDLDAGVAVLTGRGE